MKNRVLGCSSIGALSPRQSAFCLLLVFCLAGMGEMVCAQQQAAVPQISLKPCPNLPRSRRMHGCAVVGNRLYVIGGSLITYGWTDTVYSAEILTTGPLGQWREELPLPERRTYISNSVEAVNDRIYVVAGTIADSGSTPEKETKRAQDVLWTTVVQDGSLDEWKRSLPFPGPARSNIATASDDKHLFIIGGSAPNNLVCNDVLVADLAETGFPINWRKSGDLPVPLWFGGAGILEDRLYVWGGLTGPDPNSVNPGVFCAKVRPDGTLDKWTEQAPMSMPLYSSAFCAFNDYLICAGGRYDGAKPTTDIWYTQLVDERVQSWQRLKTNLAANVYLSLGLDRSRGWVFVVGGQLKEEKPVAGRVNISSSAQMFRLPQAKSSMLEINQVTAAASASAPPASPGTPVFLGIDDARREAAKTGKRVLVLFYSPEVPACKRFWDKVIAANIIASTTNRFVWAAVDISKDRTEQYKYSVFKVPAIILLSSSGTVISRSIRMIEPSDLSGFLAGI